ncbi:MAG TPA: LLM class F420-dependent oxidoreductase [Acidimicrobiales bacterium]
MDFGIVFANTGPHATPDGARAIARGAEAAGFESLWTVEHVIIPDGYQSEYPYDPSGKIQGGDSTDIPDPLIWLAFLAGQTTTIKLGTGILILPQRNPVVLAKECASLDKLSDGRLLLGIGVGWLEEEFDALGVPFHDRGKRTDDYVHAMRALWSEPIASYHSDFVNFDGAISQPKPVGGSVPIVIGGHTEIAARRAGRLGDGFFPGKGSNDDLRRLIAVMRATAEEYGRDPDAIEITTGGAAAFAPDPVDALGELAELGVSRVVIPPLSFNPTKIADKLAEFGENVIARVNA